MVDTTIRPQLRAALEQVLAGQKFCEDLKVRLQKGPGFRCVYARNSKPIKREYWCTNNLVTRRRNAPDGGPHLSLDVQLIKPSAPQVADLVFQRLTDQRQELTGFFRAEIGEGEFRVNPTAYRDGGRIEAGFTWEDIDLINPQKVPDYRDWVLRGLMVFHKRIEGILMG